MTNPTPTDVPPLRAGVRVGGVSAGVAVLLAGAGYWPTQAVAGAEAVPAMLAAIGISLVGAWAGLIPTLAYLRKPPQEHPIGILGGLVVRFVVTVGAALALYLVGVLPERPLLLWVGLSQFILLGVDVFHLVGLLKAAAAKETP
jgi:hypothetical protein